MSQGSQGTLQELDDEDQMADVTNLNQQVDASLTESNQDRQSLEYDNEAANADMESEEDPYVNQHT